MSETVYRKLPCKLCALEKRRGVVSHIVCFHLPDYEPIEPNPLDEVERLKATISMDTVRLKLALEAILNFTANERIHGSAWQRIRREAHEAIDAALNGEFSQPVEK